MELTDAVSLAVEECLRADILTDFLPEHKAEVVAMSIYEYNEEYVKRVEREDAMEEGYAKGYDSGYNSGYGKGINSGMELGEARKLVQIINSVLPNFENSLELTCQKLNITAAEYEHAKLLISDSQN